MSLVSALEKFNSMAHQITQQKSPDHPTHAHHHAPPSPPTQPGATSRQPNAAGTRRTSFRATVIIPSHSVARRPPIFPAKPHCAARAVRRRPPRLSSLPSRVIRAALVATNAPFRRLSRASRSHGVHVRTPEQRRGRHPHGAVPRRDAKPLRRLLPAERLGPERVDQVVGVDAVRVAAADVDHLPREARIARARARESAAGPAAERRGSAGEREGERRAPRGARSHGGETTRSGRGRRARRAAAEIVALGSPEARAHGVWDDGSTRPRLFGGCRRQCRSTAGGACVNR